MKKIVILGAGIAGISAAYHAKKLGFTNVCVFEKSSRVGGLVDNFQMEGFRFDHAVHLSFTKSDYIKKMFAKVPYNVHKPLSYNYENGLWIKHPVQNNLNPLLSSEKVAAIKSFIERPSLGNNDYRSWLVSQFGEYIAERYPIRYTKKYWTVDAERLSIDWIGNRMSQPDIEQILSGAFDSETPNFYYANEMRYPKNGGYKAFIQPMIDEVNLFIQLNSEVMVVNEKDKWIEFSNGKREYYDVLISSLPLPELMQRTVHASYELKRAANTLWATSVALVSIGFNRPDIPKYLWFYIYDESILAARAYSPNMKADSNAPEHCSSLQFEIYFSKFSPLNMQPATVIEHIVDKLEEMGIATRNDILITDYRELKYGNVAFDHGMIGKREAMKSYMKENNIHLIGRFGEWDYLWSDQSLLSGKNVVEKLHRGEI